MTTVPSPTPSRPPAYERIFDKLIESPFTTLWNLTAIIGGLLALIYFTQLGYLPDLDLKNSAAFFFSIAIVSIFLLMLLVAVFNIPSWMLRGDALAASLPAQKKWAPGVRVVLNGFLAALTYLLLIGLFGLRPEDHELARQITWASGSGIALCSVLIACLVLRPITLNVKQLFAWLVVTPSFWMMALMRFRAPEGPLVSLLVACGFIAGMIVVNAILATIRFSTWKVWLASVVLALSLPIIYLVLPSDGPGIPESAFRKLSLGGMANTTLVVKLPACEAVNVLQKNACTPLASKQVGCITPPLMANRLGEYLLVFGTGDKKTKVPLQKADVILWSSATRPPVCPSPD